MISASGAIVALSLLFASAKSAAYDETYRPQFHFSPTKNWMNDPNGLFQDNQGYFHMFYQYNPFGDEWGHMSWGHASSKDMVHWEEQEVALFEENGVMIYSGSAVVDEKNTTGWQQGDQEVYVLIYTGNSDSEENQNLAYSLDGGKKWTKYANNPVLRIPGEKNFRDPKVMWYGDEQKWVMTVSLSQEQKVHFYESKDLINWNKTGEFEIQAKDNSVWECPDLILLTCPKTDIQKWVLIVNVNPGGYQAGSGAKYFIGNFTGQTFIADDPLRVDYVDYGSDFYAVTSYFSRENAHNKYGVSAVAWMSNWLYSFLQPTSPWRGQMSFPRIYQLTSYNSTIYLRAILDWKNGMKQIATNTTLRLSQGNESLETVNAKVKDFVSQNSDLYYIKAYFEKPVGDFEFGINVRTDYNQTKTVIGVKKDCSIYVDRTKSGDSLISDLFFNQKDVKTAYDCHNEKKVKLEAIIDRSSVEAFFFNWYSMTNTIFTDENNKGIELWTSDPAVKIKYLKIEVLQKSMGSNKQEHLLKQQQNHYKFQTPSILEQRKQETLNDIENFYHRVQEKINTFANELTSGIKALVQ